MRLTIELDTNDITDRDRRVLASLVSDDGAPLVLPLPRAGVDHTPASTPTGPPSPVPAPPAFMQRLGEAVGQFGRPPAAASEARLPVVQQAGVTTRSTMPDDDDELPAEDQRVFGVDVAGDTATVVAGAVRDGIVHITDHHHASRELYEDDGAAGAALEADLVERMAGAELGPNAERGDADVRVPDVERVHIDEPALHIVSPPPPAHADRDRVQRAILGTVDAPVRHTTP